MLMLDSLLIDEDSKFRLHAFKTEFHLSNVESISLFYQPLQSLNKEEHFPNIQQSLTPMFQLILTRPDHKNASFLCSYHNYELSAKFI